VASELLQRLRDPEDQFVERKLEGAGSSEFKKALVAFANSVPPNRTAILFVGAADNGELRGVSNPDKLQRTLRNLAETECYPPIYINLESILESGATAVAAIISHSTRRPHFAGPAYIRRGSESIVATEEVYRDLLLSQDDKRRFLIDHKDDLWTLEFLNKEPGATEPLFDTHAKSSAECKIIELTAFFVRFRNISSNILFTEMLLDIHVSYDDKRQRPKLAVWPTGRV
jgi:hypothetical protein